MIWQIDSSVPWNPTHWRHTVLQSFHTWCYQGSIDIWSGSLRFLHFQIFWPSLTFFWLSLFFKQNFWSNFFLLSTHTLVRLWMKFPFSLICVWKKEQKQCAILPNCWFVNTILSFDNFFCESRLAKIRYESCLTPDLSIFPKISLMLVHWAQALASGRCGHISKFWICSCSIYKFHNVFQFIKLLFVH